MDRMERSLNVKAVAEATLASEASAAETLAIMEDVEMLGRAARGEADAKEKTSKKKPSAKKKSS
jgi:hypothetical protein